LKRVFSSHDRIAVHHARNVLEAGGIRAVVKNEYLASAMGELPPAECQAEVWVLRETDAQLAENFLRDAFSSTSGEAWNCSNCGEASEPQFAQCWRCGAARP